MSILKTPWKLIPSFPWRRDSLGLRPSHSRTNESNCTFYASILRKYFLVTSMSCKLIHYCLTVISKQVDGARAWCVWFYSRHGSQNGDSTWRSGQNPLPDLGRTSVFVAIGVENRRRDRFTRWTARLVARTFCNFVTYCAVCCDIVF